MAILPSEKLAPPTVPFSHTIVAELCFRLRANHLQMVGGHEEFRHPIPGRCRPVQRHRPRRASRQAPADIYLRGQVAAIENGLLFVRANDTTPFRRVW